jgi:hypothetical protein
VVVLDFSGARAMRGRGMTEMEALILLLSPFLVMGKGGAVAVAFWVEAVVVGMVIAIRSAWKQPKVVRPPVGRTALRAVTVPPARAETAQYKHLAATPERVEEWRQFLESKPLGGAEEVALKNLLDRAFLEELFDVFGDSFVALMKVQALEAILPRRDVPREMWRALVGQQFDILICHRSTLKPVVGFLIGAGGSEVPAQQGMSSPQPTPELYARMSDSEREKWIAGGMLAAAGAKVCYAPRSVLREWLEDPGTLLAQVEGDLRQFLAKSALVGAATA